MQIDLDKLSIDSLIQIILIVFFIIQTFYLVRQTNFGVKSSQANLKESWKKEIDAIDWRLLSSVNITKNEEEFQKLIDILSRMNYQFKEKLLRPLDFADVLIQLHSTINNESFRKTAVFKENYLKLQIIYSNFKRNGNVIIYAFNLMPTSAYEEAFMSVKRLRGDVGKKMLSNWVVTQLALKIGVWWMTNVKREDFFELKSPIV